MTFQVGETRFEFEGFGKVDVARFQAAIENFTISSAELQVHRFNDVFVSHISALGNGKYRGGVFDSEAKPIVEGIVRRHGEGVVVGSKPSEAAGTTEHYKQAVYGGVLFSGFGHIILESASRLWAAKQLPDLPILFQTMDGNDAGKAMLAVIADLLGIAAHRIRFTSNDVRISRAYVPAPGVVLGAMTNNNYLNFIRTALSRFERGHGKSSQTYLSRTAFNWWHGQGKSAQTYLSRAGLNWRQRRGIGEVELENVLKEKNYGVIRTEGLSLSDQIAAINKSSTLAGFIGSQFHLMFLRSSPQPLDVLYLCSSRPNLNFFQIDTLIPGRRIYSNVSYYEPAFEFGNRSPFQFEPAAMKENFARIGMPIGDYVGPSTGEFIFHWALAYFYFKIFREGLIGDQFTRVAERGISGMMRRFTRSLSSDEREHILGAFKECARRHPQCEQADVREVERQLRSSLGGEIR